jgi:hypothetical protein
VVADHDVGAAPCQFQGDRAAYVARAAGDECNSSAEVIAAHPRARYQPGES